MTTARQEWYREKYLKSRYWKWVRRLIGERADWRCEVLGCRRVGWALNAHHTTYAVMFFEWLFPWTLIYLCPDHHADTHAGKRLRITRGLWGRWLKPFERKA